MKRLIKMTSVALIICMLFTLVSFASNGKQNEKITYRSISIIVNGTEIAPCDVNGNSTEPFIRNVDGSTYLPVRAVGGALGLNVDWNDENSTVILKSGGTIKTGDKDPVKTNREVKADLYYRDIVIALDGKAVELKNAKGEPVEPFIKDGTTYIPVRAVATALGCEVGWNGDTNTVTITKGIVDPDPQMQEPLKIENYTSVKYVNGEDYGTFNVEAAGGEEPYSYKWEYEDEMGWKDCSDNPSVFEVKNDSLKENVFANGFAYNVRCTVTDAAGDSVTSEVMECYKQVNSLNGQFLAYVKKVNTYNKGTAHEGLGLVLDIVNGEVHVGDTIVIYDDIKNEQTRVKVNFIADNAKEADVANSNSNAQIAIGAPFGFDSDNKPVADFISQGCSIVIEGSTLRPAVQNTNKMVGTVKMYKASELAENNPGKDVSSLTYKMKAGDAVYLGYVENPLISFRAEVLVTPDYDEIYRGATAENVEMKNLNNALIYVGQEVPIYRDGIKYGTFKIKHVVE